MSKKIILSGIQATGKLTLGNYLGAINNWVRMQEEYNCYYMIANLHSLTVRNEPEELKNNTLKILALYIAAGLNPEKNTIFIQSQVKEHAELGWILDCYTYMGELSRMTQFKDKSQKHADNINAGLFTYPALMAADILLYKADLVPVGEDQRQHLEITRDLAERFNKLYGETFVIPEAYVRKESARIMGLQDPTSKMSKSATNLNDVIFLEDEPEVILKKFKKAVTDSENIVKFDPETKPGVSNLMQIYASITNKTMEEIEKEFEGSGYGNFKTTVAEAVINTLKPIQEKYKMILNDKEYLEKIYIDGANRARELASKTLNEVKEKIGIL
ncbi:MAG: tryptophan--tRNA ligase [Clostridia bacterium]|nr:tryptophan--tRNA ligase [Clostridiales bacterium]MBQ6992812.1 tryptophan--tRNA ligase [Clostridia bacterium]